MSSGETHSEGKMHRYVSLVPWDTKAFGCSCFEVEYPLGTVTEQTTEAGHYTVKVDPLADKGPLHRAGFYYSDTLLEPYCRREMLQPAESHDVAISHDCSLDELLALSQGAYRHGRFHRDFNMPTELADLRYDNWVRDLFAAGNCFGLLIKGELAAYFAVNGNKVVLHAVAQSFRGKGLAKPLWSVGYQRMFELGHSEVCSSVSATNMAVVNLYASLGFRFRNPVDVYHKLVPAG